MVGCRGLAAPAGARGGAFPLPAFAARPRCGSVRQLRPGGGVQTIPVGVAVVALLFGSAMLAMALARRLPEYHLS